MTTKVQDRATMVYALVQAGVTTIKPVNEAQADFAEYFGKYAVEIASMQGLKAKAANNAAPLNTFLTDNGFKPMFRDDLVFGVASILDLLVEWLHEAGQTTIFGKNAEGTWDSFPAFQLPMAGVKMYRVAGHSEPLVRLLTKSGDSVWLMKYTQPQSDVLVATAAQALADAELVPYTQMHAGITIPMLEIDTEPDIAWTIGMETNSPLFRIDEAFQQYKLRMNQVGAHVKVATGFATRGGPSGPLPYVFDEPFIGWFTLGDSQVAVAPFFADTDTWKSSGESLEDL